MIRCRTESVMDNWTHGGGYHDDRKFGGNIFFCFDGWNDDKKINKNAKWQRHRLFGCYSYRNEMRWKGRDDWRWSLLVDGAIKWEDTAIRNTRRLVSFEFLLLFRFGLFVYCVSTVSRSLARSHASRKPSNNGALAGLGQVGRRLDSCTTQQLTVFCFDCALSYKFISWNHKALWMYGSNPLFVSIAMERNVEIELVDERRVRVGIEWPQWSH